MCTLSSLEVAMHVLYQVRERLHYNPASTTGQLRHLFRYNTFGPESEFSGVLESVYGNSDKESFI